MRLVRDVIFGGPRREGVLKVSVVGSFAGA